jgi:hypothetical protein
MAAISSVTAIISGSGILSSENFMIELAVYEP